MWADGTKLIYEKILGSPEAITSRLIRITLSVNVLINQEAKSWDLHPIENLIPIEMTIVIRSIFFGLFNPLNKII